MFLTRNGFFVAVATFAVFMANASAAGTRYQDRLFEVTKMPDVEFAKNVPHLSSYHTITTSMLAYNVKNQLMGDDPITVAYFYNNETETTNKSLLMDIYMPKGDSEKKRAAVIVSHGGAMVAGSRDDATQHTVNYCDSLAARGFVTASIEYRLGVTLTGKDYQLHIDSVDFARAVYRGVQDIRAAVRYMRKNADKYGIDPERIYLVGNSAGAIISLEDIYANSEEDFPSYINKAGAPDLGTLDLYGEPNVDARANGGAFLWGAVHNLKMIGDNPLPVLLIHGTADVTVPFKTGRPLSNVAEVLMNIIPSEMGATAASYALDLHAPTLYGSFVIDSALTAQGTEHETYFVKGVTHEFYDDAPYTTKVQEKVFSFLYKLTQSEPVVRSAIEPRAFALTRPTAVHMGEGNLNFSVSRGHNLKYTVVDLRGRSAMTGNVSAGETVDLQTLGNGVYVLCVQGQKPMRFGLKK